MGVCLWYQCTMAKCLNDLSRLLVYRVSQSTVTSYWMARDQPNSRLHGHDSLNEISHLSWNTSTSRKICIFCEFHFIWEDFWTFINIFTWRFLSFAAWHSSTYGKLVGWPSFLMSSVGVLACKCKPMHFHCWASWCGATLARLTVCYDIFSYNCSNTQPMSSELWTDDEFAMQYWTHEISMDLAQTLCEFSVKSGHIFKNRPQNYECFPMT